jgi:site-specific recombinase XerD
MNDRKHLVSTEVDKLIEATGSGRNAARDRCLLLLMFRHGLRVSKACGLKSRAATRHWGSPRNCHCRAGEGNENRDMGKVKPY